MSSHARQVRRPAIPQRPASPWHLGHTTNCCAHAAHSPTDCPLTDRSMRPDYGEPGRVSLAQTDEKYALECLFVGDADGV